MKLFAVLLATFLAGVSAAAQEVNVSLVLESEGFLANEPIFVKVKIDNESGQTIRLNGTPDWLTFTVTTDGGGYVKVLRTPDLPKDPIVLDSSKTANLKVNLAPAFALGAQGHYKVVATLKVPAFNATFASGAKAFFVNNGTKRWETTFGVPASIAPTGPDGRPELRKYSLVESNYGNETRLYARVTDPLDHNLRVVPIGTLVSFSTIEQQTDKWMNLHILFQNGAKSFCYSVITPDGFMLARERHEFTDTRPIMAANSEGRISIRGGQRRYTSSDIPPVDEKLIGPPEMFENSNYEEIRLKPTKDGKKKPAPPENEKKK